MEEVVEHETRTQRNKKVNIDFETINDPLLLFLLILTQGIPEPDRLPISGVW